jgi:hypothetical protein
MKSLDVRSKGSINLKTKKEGLRAKIDCCKPWIVKAKLGNLNERLSTLDLEYST